MFVSTKLSQRYELILDPEAETSPLSISVFFDGGECSFEFVFFYQYKPHYDYFFDEEHKKNNRMATILVYLTTPEEGGETIFPGAPAIPIGSTDSLFTFAHVRVGAGVHRLRSCMFAWAGLRACCAHVLRWHQDRDQSATFVSITGLVDSLFLGFYSGACDYARDDSS